MQLKCQKTSKLYLDKDSSEIRLLGFATSKMFPVLREESNDDTFMSTSSGKQPSTKWDDSGLTLSFRPKNH